VRKVLNATSYELSRLIYDEGPTCIIVDEHEQTIAILDQLAMKRINLRMPGLEYIEPPELNASLDTVRGLAGMATSANRP
jgi:hypothetical protein